MAAPSQYLGQTLGRYRLVEQIGAGGTSVVYRAHDEQLDRDVAVKVLNPGMLASDATRRRFRKEALALAKLNHPNVATIFEFGSANQTDYLVTEYIVGQSLSERIASGVLPESGIIGLGIQLVQGLIAAHSQAIVHRDLKPANLRLTPDGRLKILDFGLAQLIPHASASGATATMTSESPQVVGTLPYMAPEQLRGELADARTDVWAAGAVMYEMATAHQPFEANSAMALAGDIIHRVPPVPQKWRRGLSAQLQAVILKCLEKAPANRYQSADELKIALERLLLPFPAPSLAPKIAAFALVAVFLAAAGWVIVRQRARLSPMLGGNRRRSIAVLSFKNLSAKNDQEWLSTAISELLTTELEADGKLRAIPGEDIARATRDLVIPDTDSLSRGTLTRLHQALGTDLVVLGSFLDQNGEIRLDVRLQDTAAGETVVTVSNTGTEARLVDLASQTGAHLRANLGLAVASPAAARTLKATMSSNPNALRLYSEGLAKLRIFDALAARDLLTKAIAGDDDFALAHSALAEAWSKLGYDERARYEAKKAFDRSRNLSREQQLFVEGQYHATAKEWDKAIDVYHSLWSFFPDNLEYGLRLAKMQTVAGRPRESLNTVSDMRKGASSQGDPRINLAEADAFEALGDFKDELSAASEAMAKAERRGTRFLVADALHSRAWALYKLGRLPEAGADLQEARQIYRSAGDEEGVIKTLGVTATLIEDLGRLDDAVRINEECLAVARRIGSQHNVLVTLNNLATVYYQQGNLRGAKETWGQALAIAREVADKSDIAATLANLGNASYQEGDLDEAKTRYDETLAVSREIGDQSTEAQTIGNIASVMRDEGDLIGGTNMYRRSLAMSRQLGDKEGEATALINIGSTVAEQGDLMSAKRAIDEAMVICRGIGDQALLANALSALGDLLVLQGDLDAAGRQYAQALALAKQTHQDGMVAQVDVAAAELSIEDGDPARAFDLASGAKKEFQKEHVSEEEIAADVVVIRALLAQGHLTNARKYVSATTKRVNQSKNFESHVKFSIVAAETYAASGEVEHARELLHSVSNRARKGADRHHQFEAQLVTGKIELRFNRIAGRAELASLAREAEVKGFHLIARKAAAAMKG